MSRAVLAATLGLCRLAAALAVTGGGFAVFLGVGSVVHHRQERLGLLAIPLGLVVAGVIVVAAGFYADARICAADRRLDPDLGEHRQQGFEVVNPTEPTDQP